MRAARAQRRMLTDLDNRLTDDELADWALVCALAQHSYYESRIRRNRVR